VRASNTQPAITLRFEARTNEQLTDYIRQFDALLSNYPEIDRGKLLAQLEAISSQ
jgi:phosphomannomutase